jgi:uncharacterized protein YndB with AHSA1/START domain
MITFHKSIFINRPVEEIFRYATDNRFFDRWMPNLVFSKLSSEGDTLAVGSTLLQRMVMGSDSEDVMGRVVAFESERRWAYTGLGEKYCFRRMWSFERLSKGTKVHFYEELSTRKSLPIYFAILLRYKTGKANTQSLEALKRELDTSTIKLSSAPGR